MEANADAVNLMEIYRLTMNGFSRVRMSELRSGDLFRYGPEGSISKVFKATSDPYFSVEYDCHTIDAELVAH